MAVIEQGYKYITSAKVGHYGPELIHRLEYDKESDSFVIRVQFSYKQAIGAIFEELIVTKTLARKHVLALGPTERQNVIRNLIIGAENEAVTGHNQVKLNREKLVNAIIEYEKE